MEDEVCGLWNRGRREKTSQLPSIGNFPSTSEVEAAQFNSMNGKYP